MRFVFKVILHSNEYGIDCFNCVIYAQNNQSAFNKLFKQLGSLRQYLIGVFIDFSLSDEVL